MEYKTTSNISNLYLSLIFINCKTSFEAFLFLLKFYISLNMRKKNINLFPFLDSKINLL